MGRLDAEARMTIKTLSLGEAIKSEIARLLGIAHRRYSVDYVAAGGRHPMVSDQHLVRRLR